MSRAREQRKKLKKKTEKTKTVKKKKTAKTGLNKLALIVIIAVVIGIVFAVTLYAVNNAKVSKYTKTITKEQARKEVLGFEPTIANPRALSNPLRVADNFAAEDLEKDGKKVGTEVIVFIDNPSATKSKKIPSEAFMLLIVDNDLNVKGLVPFKPTYFDIGGKVNFDKFFNAFKGKKAIALINRFDGIYTDDSNTALVIKNKVREAMSLLYIEKYGANAYDKIAKGGFIFAERGTKVPDISFTDINGIKHKLSDFKSKKIILIGGNPNCGGCVSNIERLSYEFKKYGTNGVQFILFSFSSNKDDAKNITRFLPKDTIVVSDPDRMIAKKVKMNTSPYIGLIDKNLSLFYMGPGEPTKDTLDNIKQFLGGK